MQYRAQEGPQGPGSQAHLHPTSCQICNMNSDQIRQIVMHLISTLRNIDPEELSENIYDCGGFSRMLKLIFHSKCKNFRDTTNCIHAKAQTLFLDKLGITSAALDKISNKKIISLAKYNFHLDAVSLQVKSFPRHFASIENRKQAKKGRRNMISPQKTERTGIPSKKLIQQKEKTPPTKHAQKYGIVKQEAPQSQELKHKTECMQYHMSPGTFTYHPIRFDNTFEQMMNNMLMLTYGFPATQP